MEEGYGGYRRSDELNLLHFDNGFGRFRLVFRDGFECGGKCHLERGYTYRYRAGPSSRHFEPDDREHSVFAWLRRAPGAAPVLVVCNMTPVPRPGYRLGVPAPAAGGPPAWPEVMNTDSVHYGGSNLGNGGAPLPTEPQPWQRQPASVVLTLPPLATLFLVPA